MTTTPQRYAPQRPFPPYAFLPGEHPHPTRDTDGHSYQEYPGPALEHRDAEHWRDNETYLYGLDLYNHGYLWEAHEAWEAVWHAAKHDELQAQFIQGLIQCAAGALKARMQQPLGLTKLMELGTARLEFVARATDARYMGADVADLVRAFRAFAAMPEALAEDRPIIVLSVTDQREA